MTDRDQIVISGIGVLTSVGRGTSELGRALRSGRSGIGIVEAIRDAGLRSWLGAAVHLPPGSDGPGRRALRGLTRPEALVLTAVHDALVDAGISSAGVSGDRTGLYVAGHKCTSDLAPMLDGLRKVRAAKEFAIAHAVEPGAFSASHSDVALDERSIGEHAKSAFSPLFYVEGLQSLALYNASRHWNITGPCLYVHGSGDAGLVAMRSAVRALERGEVDVAVVAAAGEDLTPWESARLDAMGLLTVENDAGPQACRPYDTRRSGSVLGEGAVALVLQRKEPATRWMASVLGIGLGLDGARAPAPDPTARGVGVAVTRALELADRDRAPVGVSHVIGHGSGTRLGDESELRALSASLRGRGESIRLHSVKPQTGHLGSAAGLLNVVVSVIALVDRRLPATMNHAEPDPSIPAGMSVSGGVLDGGVGVVVSRGVEGQAGAVVLDV